MIIHFNYADEKFKKHQSINTKSVKKYIKEVKTLNYNPDDIDSEFRDKNKKILIQKKGNGYWLWKPYFLKKVYERSNTGDIIIYTDSGLIFNKEITELIEKFIEQNLDFYFYDLPLLEQQWTKNKVINYFREMGLRTIEFKNQLSANFFIIKKTDKTEIIVNEYLRICQIEGMLDDTLEDEQEYFINHRHDQSILSMLAHLHKIKKYKDQTDYGTFPLRYYQKGRAIYSGNTKPITSNHRPVALAFKRESAYIYRMKFFLKELIAKIGLFSKNLYKE